MDRLFLKLLNNYKHNSRNYVRGTRLNPNPGVQRQLKVFSEQRTENHSVTDEFEDMESNFMNVSEQHKYWEKEAKKHKVRITNEIVKHKYFHAKLPNFLTWSEKEQIRQLHNDDPEEWNHEKLADSFPADVDTIAKIIKAKWSPNDENRIKKHDYTVKRNWELLKQNQLENISPLHARHLRKFINRENFSGYNLKTISLAKQGDFLKLHAPKSNEFSSIITNFNKAKIEAISSGENHPNYGVNKPKPERLDESRDLVVKNNKPITLANLKNQNREEQNDTRLRINIENDKKIGIRLDQHVDLMETEDNESNKLVHLDVERGDIIEERIKIPKKLWKEGATYKVKDCFYADDGEFLYRVPGMN